MIYYLVYFIVALLTATVFTARYGMKVNEIYGTVVASALWPFIPVAFICIKLEEAKVFKNIGAITLVKPPKCPKKKK